MSDKYNYDFLEGGDVKKGGKRNRLPEILAVLAIFAIIGGIALCDKPKRRQVHKKTARTSAPPTKVEKKKVVEGPERFLGTWKQANSKSARYWLKGGGWGLRMAMDISKLTLEEGRHRYADPKETPRPELKIWQILDAKLLLPVKVTGKRNKTGYGGIYETAEGPVLIMWQKRGFLVWYLEREGDNLFMTIAKKGLTQLDKGTKDEWVEDKSSKALRVEYILVPPDP